MLCPPFLAPIHKSLLYSLRRRYVTRPSSDDEDDGDEKGKEEEGKRIDRDESLYKWFRGQRENLW